MESNNEVWVFLSHSNKDYEKVCLVRDRLEAKNFRPLMFFLKCLDDNAEIEDLIKREIDARTRFLLCESKNSNTAKWVKMEKEHIENSGRMYDVVNLDRTIEDIEIDVMRFCTRSTVFLSYSRNDSCFASALEKELIKNHFKVFFDRTSLKVGCNFALEVSNAIYEASKKGYVLFILSKHSLSSPLAVEELRIAISKGAYIVCVRIDNTELKDETDYILSKCPIINVADLSQNDAITKVVKDLVEIDKKKYQNR